MTDPFDGIDLDELTAAFREASEVALGWWRRPLDVDNKIEGGFDPVTEADRTVERRVREVLRHRFPDHAVVGEEYGRNGGGPAVWWIDPVDGTRSFVAGSPLWGTLVGLVVDGRPVAGWMHLPATAETFVATPSGAWYLDGGGARRELGVRARRALDRCTVLSTHPSMFDDRPDDWRRLESAVQLTRFGGDCANYGLLALGTVDVVVDRGLASYDILPLIPVIEAAGGVVLGEDGEPLGPIEDRSGVVVAASDAELGREVLERLGHGRP